MNIKEYRKLYYEKNKEYLLKKQKEYNNKIKEINKCNTLYESFVEDTGHENVGRFNKETDQCDSFRKYIKYICEKENIDLTKINNNLT